MKYFAGRRLACLLTVAMAVSTVGCVTSGGRSRASRQRDDGAPKVGDDAPAFTLKMLKDQSKTVELAASRGQKPVILFFGSYT